MSTSTQSRESKSPERSGLDSFFKLTERHTTVGQELRGGLVTFITMAYILILNPVILSAIPDSGVTPQAIAAGTALVAGLLTIAMGVFANFPIAMASGMGLNAIVAFSLGLGLGLTYQEAMGLVFWEGILILILVLTGFRQAVFRAVPQQLRSAISVGIGLFIAFVGLINAGIVRPGGTPVQIGVDGSLVGWPALIFVLGLVLIVILYTRKVKGAILIGIASATVLAFIVQMIARIPAVSDEVPGGWASSVPEISGSLIQTPDFSTLGAIDFFGAFQKLGWLPALLLIFSLMLADFFDTMGTMVAVGSEGDLLDEEGTPYGADKILIVDSLGAIAGGLGGVSSNTAYVESSAGVGEGARSGLASVFTGAFFLLSIFLAPLVTLVPSEAASTALVFVGFLMMTQVTEIDWTNAEIAIPAFLTIALMPFGYSITAGIGAGFVFYTVIQAARGKASKVHPLMWVVSALFVVYFALGPIQSAIGG
ncbi:NCS2 family permease [Actinomycetaceae bacterium MB13-C1-2]|nr:NCS2 family permease [Actinomycetaceae bacterium MB13-C1-2]